MTQPSSRASEMPSLPFRPLVEGYFAESQVVTRWRDWRRAVPPPISSLIDSAWQEAVRSARAAGQELFAGPLCRLLSWHVRGEILVLELGPTDYREFVGTNLRHPELASEVGAEAMANPLGVSTAIVTRDQHVVVQYRSGWVYENPGMLHVCGGNLDREDVVRGGPFSTARREVVEELGVPPASLTEAWCLGLVEACDSLKPEAIMAVTLDLDHTDLRVASKEVAALQCVPLQPASLAHVVLGKHGQLTAQGLACLIALGRHHFGDSWASAVMRQRSGSGAL